MKYLKSFFGMLVFSLLIILMAMPVIVITLLGGFVNPWFLFGELIALPMTMMIITKLAWSDKLNWVLRLMSAAFDE